MSAEDRRRGRWQIARTVGAAAAVAYIIEIALQVWLGGISAVDVFKILSAYFVLFVVFFVIGRWLGKRTWPKRGHKLARAMLRRRVKRQHEFLFVSDRPDRGFTTLQRVWEVVGFAAGASVLVSTLLLLVGFPPPAAFLLALVATWGSFVLVPYWLFARLGFRIVDPVRWFVLPLSRGYADRLKLSNGALVLLAAGASFNLAFRAGLSNAEALSNALVLVLRLVALVLVTAATAVAYYAREERRVAHELELEALALGIRDGRGMTDGEFLPRLPAKKAT